MSDNGTQRLTLAVDVTPDTCAICRTIPGDDVKRLTLDLADQHNAYRVTVCRPCLADKLPGLLAEIEGG